MHAVVLLLFCAAWSSGQPTDAWDVIVYGASPGGIAAAIAARRLKASVLLVEPSSHIGGMTSGGLGRTDVGPHPTSYIGGIPYEFFVRNARHYDPSANEPEWNVEPHVASELFLEMLTEVGVHVVTNTGYVTRMNDRISPFVDTKNLNNTDLQHIRPRAKPSPSASALESTTIVTERTSFSGYVIVDASYDGDVVAVSGTQWTYGREANNQYNETLNGRTSFAHNHGNQFISPVTGVDLDLWLFGDGGALGAADEYIESFNFRLCVVKKDNGKIPVVPFPAPQRYNASAFSFFRNFLKSVNNSPRFSFGPLPNNKFDFNNAGPMSTDWIGGNKGYPTMPYSRRQAVWAAHKEYQLQIIKALVDAGTAMKDYGLCGDEFTSTENWPPPLYIREVRRMVSEFVFTQNTAAHQSSDSWPNPAFTGPSIGMGGYNFDDHAAQRLLCTDDNRATVCPDVPADWKTPFVINEGDVEVYPGQPYEIPYATLLAQRGIPVLSPYSPSASHTGLATLRMEPTYMVMGQAAGTAAALSVLAGVTVHDVDRHVLAETLSADHVIRKLSSA